MKKTISIFLALVLCLSLCACGGSKAIALGQTFTYVGRDVVLLDVEVSNCTYVKGNKQADDFLSPFEPDIGDQFIRSADKTECPIVITFTVKNNSKQDMYVSPNQFEIDYQNGFKYYAKEIYARLDGKNWKDYDELTTLPLEKLTSGTVEVRTVVWVPKEVVEDTDGSLVLELYGKTYVIR